MLHILELWGIGCCLAWFWIFGATRKSKKADEAILSAQGRKEER